MAYELTALREARTAARTLRASGVADKDIPDQLRRSGVDPALAPIVLRQLDVEKAGLLADNGRRDIHYGLLTAGSALVIAVISSAIPFLTIVFGAAILIGLAWMGRGFFFRWRAERIAPGIYKGTFRELFGGYAGDMIKQPDEVLEDRAAFAVSIKRARKNANYFSFFLAGVVFVTLFLPMSTVDDPYAFFYLIMITFAVLFAAFFASYELLFRAENLPPPRPFAKKVERQTDEPVQRYAAPHFSAAPVGGDDAVLFAAAHNHLPAQSAAIRYKEEMVFGVLYATTQGIAFLPDIPLDNNELRTIGRVAVDLAASAHPVLETIRDAVMEKVDAPETLPQWLEKAREHPVHFVIAWADLVETGHDPKTHSTTLVKDTGSGSPETYALIGLGNLMAPYLFNLKLRHERHKVLYDVVLQPKYAQFHDELMPHFEQIYGEAWRQHIGELDQAINARLATVKTIEPAEQAEIERRLQPLMPAMEATPLLVIRDGSIQLDTGEPEPPASDSGPPPTAAKAAGS
ncbi:MAG: hypothetical protein AB7R90_09695 [Reyranellaceae bacterium]